MRKNVKSCLEPLGSILGKEGRSEKGVLNKNQQTRKASLDQKELRYSFENQKKNVGFVKRRRCEEDKRFVDY